MIIYTSVFHSTSQLGKYSPPFASSTLKCIMEAQTIEHVSHYQTTPIPICIPIEDTNEVMCKVFLTSLKGHALT